jgi:alpha-mannosidase
MALTSEQRIARLRKRLIELQQWIVRDALPLDRWTFNGKPWAAGEPWPTREGVATLAHPNVEAPAKWPLERVRLDLDLGGEGLLRLKYSERSEEAFGLDPNHVRFPLKTRRFEISAQTVARLPFGVPNRGARLERARLILIEPDLSDLVLYLQQLIETAEVLGVHEVVPPLLSAGEDVFAALDWPTATADYIARVAATDEQQRIWELPKDLVEGPAALETDQRKSVVAARDGLVAALRQLRKRYPQNGALAMTGHAHIDLAWLWPLAETRRKANRTFSTMIRLMDRYPDFRFNASTAQLYAFLEEDDPKLLAEIKKKVSSGQWEPIGAMWVEPDTNMPTAESFARQLLYGQRYFEKLFGKRHTICWLPDCFGFSPALPQLLRLAGIESFFTIKVNWSETNKMPFDLFWWEGLDGSRVLAHTFNNPVGGYNAQTSPRAVVETWRNFRGKYLHPESLLAFGYGDGGGGPTEEMIERQRQLDDFPVVPKLRSTNVAEWYRAAHAKVRNNLDLPVWVGEMYLELHRGTLTTQGRAKYLHRHAERALITAETLSSMATLLGEPFAPSLEPHWRVVLRNEFHDILPGSSIREVYQEAEAELGEVVSAGLKVQQERLAAIAGKLAGSGRKPGILVVNPDLSPRPLRLVSSETLPNSQRIEGGSVLASDASVPGLSASIILETGSDQAATAEGRRLENTFVRVEIAEDGTIASLFDKRANRETLADRANQIWAYSDKPRNWDAWDIEDDYSRRGEEVLASKIEVVENGPHRAAIRVRRRFHDSEIVQDVRLWSNSARVEFRTDIDWHQRRTLLKARFPLAIRADFATFECAAGVIRRPTHRNTSWDEARFEVVGHRFADLSEHGYGVALLNDGKYGHHALRNELGLSLLRSPVYPDPLADEGRQSFTYALYPHQGDWLSGGVLAEAEDLNQPLLARVVKADAPSTWVAASVEGLTLGLAGFKSAEDGKALIFRTYEPAGARGKVALSLAKGWNAGGEVNLLEDRTGRASFSFSPFQLHSWRIERKKR